MPAPATLIIRRWTKNDPVSTLTNLLHCAYKPLADAGMRFVASHQDDATTLKRIQHGVGFVAENHGKIIGTITYYPPGSDQNCWWYQQDGMAFFGQFAVEPARQRTGIGSKLLDEVENMARCDHAREIALDTSEHAHHLIAYYEKRGYRRVGHTQWPETNYRSMILSKALA